MVKGSKKVIGNFLINLFHPYSPLVTLVVGGLVSSYVNIVELPLNYILIGLGIWFIIACTYQILLHIFLKLKEEQLKIEMENESLKSIIKEKDREIDRNIGLIEARYGEFSKYLMQERYITLANKIVTNFPQVDSVQIYDYSIGINTKDVEIKINYNSGYEYEGININVLKQKYYNIEKSIYLELLDIQKMYNKLMESSLDKMDKMRDIFIDDSFSLLNKLTNNKNPVNQRIFIITVEMLNNIDNGQDYGILLENDLDNCVRSGILGSILLNKDYLYYYSKNKSEKAGRTYFSFNDIIEGDNKIITLVINGTGMNVTDREQLINQVIDYYEKIYATFK